MISLDLIIIGMRHLASCYLAIGLTTSSLALGIKANPSWMIIFGKVSKLRVTMIYQNDFFLLLFVMWQGRYRGLDWCSYFDIVGCCVLSGV